MKSAVLLLTSLLASGTWAAAGRGVKLVPPPLRLEDTHASRSIGKRDVTGQGVFKQLIDHKNPSLGTFDQSFWWGSEYWQGPGSPVVFMTPGEVAASGYTGYLTDSTITGAFAKAIGGAVVLMEHRYWGNSSPYDELTTENLQYLNLYNSVHDITHFANTVDLPFDGNHSSNAANAPWVFSGGSYSGALSAWTESIAPGTFWAYHASSAVVQAIDDFWQYFAPVQQGMPKNCSADVSKVIDHIDSILLGTDPAAKQTLKEKFGLGGVEHDDDFVSVLQNGPWDWQSTDFTTGYSDFFIWCDSVENVGPLYPDATEIPGEEGVGLEKALEGYAKWIRETVVPGSCASYGVIEWGETDSVDCYDTYNASSPTYTDTSVGNPYNRQWEWYLCNQPLQFWQDGAPKDRPSIVSRLVTPEYSQRQCAMYFPGPGTFGSEAGVTVDDTNAYTGGWDLAGNTTRVIFTNGQFDPWKDATVSSDYKPGGPYQGDEDHPVQVIPAGVHCSDLIVTNGEVNAGVQKVIDNEVAVIKKWVDEYYTEKKKTRRAVRKRW